MTANYIYIPLYQFKLNVFLIQLLLSSIPKMSTAIPNMGKKTRLSRSGMICYFVKFTPKIVRPSECMAKGLPKS